MVLQLWPKRALSQSSQRRQQEDGGFRAVCEGLTNYALRARTAGRSAGVGRPAAFRKVAGENHVAIQFEGHPGYLGYMVMNRAVHRFEYKDERRYVPNVTRTPVDRLCPSLSLNFWCQLRANLRSRLRNPQVGAPSDVSRARRILIAGDRVADDLLARRRMRIVAGAGEFESGSFEHADGRGE
jgi:hypothetical protein